MTLNLSGAPQGLALLPSLHSLTSSCYPCRKRLRRPQGAVGGKDGAGRQPWAAHASPAAAGQGKQLGSSLRRQADRHVARQ